MSYDIKYRRRALEYHADGHSIRSTAAVFKVSPSTLQQWKTQIKESGNLEAKKRVETWRKIDPAKLRKYNNENPDAYLVEIAEQFGCGESAVRKAFKRLDDVDNSHVKTLSQIAKQRI